MGDNGETGRFMGRGQGDGPNRGSMNLNGLQNNGMSQRKVNQEEWSELWAEARERRRIKDRRMGMGR